MRAITGFLLAFAAALSAAAAPCRQRVEFAKGASSATYSGEVAGYDWCDYLFEAGAGQGVTVAFAGRRTNRLEAHLMDPGQEVPVPEGTPVTLESGGHHTLRVLMPRTFARRGARVRYRITLAIR